MLAEAARLASMPRRFTPRPKRPNFKPTWQWENSKLADPQVRQTIFDLREQGYYAREIVEEIKKRFNIVIGTRVVYNILNGERWKENNQT